MHGRFDAWVVDAMNVLLISANREDINMLTLPMGPACVVAAVEKAGHAVRFLDLLAVKDVPAAEYGIRRMGFLLLGGPCDTRDSVEESLAFADSPKLDALKLTVGIRIYPNTRLACSAVEEGLVAPGDPLLLPRFYLSEELRPWLRERAARWAEGRPNCFF